MAGAAKRKDPSSYEPWPLDIRLLELLPDEGLIGGVHYTGRAVKHVCKEINDAAQQVLVTTTQMQARCRVMREVGLLEHFPATGGRIWARTTKGKKLLAEHKLKQEPKPEPESEPSTPDLSPNHPAMSAEEMEESGYDGPMVATATEEKNHHANS